MCVISQAFDDETSESARLLLVRPGAFDLTYFFGYLRPCVTLATVGFCLVTNYPCTVRCLAQEHPGSKTLATTLQQTSFALSIGHGLREREFEGGTTAPKLH